MYRVLIVLALLLEPAIGQIGEGTYLARLFDGPVEGKPFQAKYIIKRSWTTLGGEYSETETGTVFRDSKGRLSKMAKGTEPCCFAQDGDWVQDPVTDIFYRGRHPDGRPWIQRLSSSLDFLFWDGNQIAGGNSRPARAPARLRRIRFNFDMPQPAQWLDEDGKRVEDAKSIGRKVIEGLDCEGLVSEHPYRIPGGYKLEYWVSSEIERIVYEKITAKDTIQVYRLHDVERVEPPESVFMIPPQ